MNIENLIMLAQKHVGNGAEMASSAQLCLTDAIKLASEGKFAYAHARALKSLAYSIGIMHPDYNTASKIPCRRYPCG